MIHPQYFIAFLIVTILLSGCSRLQTQQETNTTTPLESSDVSPEDNGSQIMESQSYTLETGVEVREQTKPLTTTDDLESIKADLKATVFMEEKF